MHDGVDVNNPRLIVIIFQVTVFIFKVECVNWILKFVFERMLPGMIYFLAANAIWDLLLHSSSFNKWHHIIDGIIITIIPLEKIIYLMMLRNITKTISTNNLAMYRRYNLLGNRWLNYKASYINIMRNIYILVYFNDLFCKIF